MEKAQSLFEIDTRGTCLFCLSSNCVPFDRTKADLTTATAFKMLFRYLNIDVSKVAIDSSTGALLLDASTNLAVSLCDACFFLVDEFLELFQEFERIRLGLERVTWKLHEFIGSGLKDEDRVREYKWRLQTNSEEHALHAKLVEGLRKATFNKCSGVRDSSFPKIRLRRGRPGNCSEGVNLVKVVETESKISGGNNIDSRPETEDNKIPMTQETDIKNLKIMYSYSVGDKPFPQRPTHLLIKHHHNNPIGSKIQARTQFQLGVPKKCTYCSKYFVSLRSHQFLVHSIQMLSQTESLPPGASEQDVKVAVDTILDSSEKGSTKHRSSCPLCLAVISGNSTKIRLHILRRHQDQVCQHIQVQRLQQVTTSTRSSDEEMDMDLLEEEKYPPKITAAPAPPPHPAQKQTSNELTLKKYNVPCDICGKSFPSRFRLKVHKYRFHPTGSFKCDLCHKTFMLDQTLQRHLRHFHDFKSQVANNPSSWRCDYCDKTIPTRKYFQQHIHFKHAMQLYASRIPSRISEHVFESTMAGIVDKILPVETANRAGQKRPCMFCGRALRCVNKFVRIHIVRNHLEELIESAGKVVMSTEAASLISCKSEYPPPPPPVISMQCDEGETGFKFDFEGDEEHSLVTEDPLAI